MTEIRHRRLATLLLAIVGLLLLWPTLAWVGLFPWKVESFENREPVAFPTSPSSLDDWVQWPRHFERYLDDHLPNRAALVRLNAWVKYHLFETSPVSNVLVGKDGWLFHRMPADLREFEGRLQRKPYQLRRLRVVLEERRDWLAERGISYLVLIAPTKQSVYPEKMPDWLVPSFSGRSRRELLLAELQQSESKLEFFDFTPALTEAKTQWGENLYYPHDSHWTYVGALQGYVALAERYPHWFRTPDQDWIDVPTTRDSNLMRLMGLPGQETVPYPQPPGGFRAHSVPPNTELLRRMAQRGAVSVFSRSDDAPKKSLYLMGDSFAGWDTIYLAENFSRTVLTNTWGQQWQRHEQFPTETISFEKPDLVIEQMLENRLDLGMPRGLLGDPKGKNHPPEVRSARLRRLMRSAGEKAANFQIVENAVEISVPAGTGTRAYIVRLDLDANEKTIIESLSPYSKEKTWEDLCVRGGELTRHAIEPGRSEVYLCSASRPDDPRLRLKLKPATGISINAVSISEHRDI